MATPYCLYLNDKGIYTIEDLLTVNLTDLKMPQELETQLEALLTIVVGKTSNAKIMPVLRDHLSTAEDLFMVPMMYDTKFQRNPLDPYGKPPRLVQKRADIHRGKKLKKSDASQKKYHKETYVELDKVHSSDSVQVDLTEKISILGPSSSAAKASKLPDQDNQWAFNPTTTTNSNADTDTVDGSAGASGGGSKKSLSPHKSKGGEESDLSQFLTPAPVLLTDAEVQAGLKEVCGSRFMSLSSSPFYLLSSSLPYTLCNQSTQNLV